MGKTVAETIKETSRKHLEEDNGLLFGQCLCAVGWISGTVPDAKKGIVELCTSEVSNTGVVVGAGLMQRRPIYAVRYQGFMWLAANTLVNYAAKCKDVWGYTCPVFVRSIAMEGNGIGPTASSSQHGLIMRMPGIPVCAPMTPNEWLTCWNWFMEHDDPVYCSEHRKSFGIDYEMQDIIHNDAVVTLIGVSAARLSALEAARLLEKDGIKCNVLHAMWLKPFEVPGTNYGFISTTAFSVIVDSDFEMSGQSLAYQLMHRYNKPVYALGLEDRTGGVAANLDNITPSPERIVSFVKERLG